MHSLREMMAEGIIRKNKTERKNEDSEDDRNSWRERNDAVWLWRWRKKKMLWRRKKFKEKSLRTYWNWNITNGKYIAEQQTQQVERRYERWWSNKISKEVFRLYCLPAFPSAWPGSVSFRFLRILFHIRLFSTFACALCVFDFNFFGSTSIPI